MRKFLFILLLAGGGLSLCYYFILQGRTANKLTEEITSAQQYELAQIDKQAALSVARLKRLVADGQLQAGEVQLATYVVEDFRGITERYSHMALMNDQSAMSKLEELRATL
ncbi:hypothetical protein ACFFSY_10420 [Paenibacillus aurantiacus]|uniref:DUF4363 family protein n=1 Tax=Paenibacillus aurantiacus TaxID=1936118 RepID=A0ABV5KQ35_9BACL